MIVARAHDLIYQIPLVGQKQKPLGVLVKTSNGVNPQGIVQIFRHGGLLALLLGAAHTAAGLVK